MTVNRLVSVMREVEKVTNSETWKESESKNSQSDPIQKKIIQSVNTNMLHVPNNCNFHDS